MSTVPKKRKSKNKSDNPTTPTPTPTDTPTTDQETPTPTPTLTDTITPEAIPTPTPTTNSTTDTAMADTHYSNRQQQQQHQQQYYGGGGVGGGQHQESLTSKLYSAAPSSRQAVKFLTASTIGTILLVLSGLTLTGTVISLIVTTPLLVLFSPILVPAAITVLLIGSGFVFSGGCGVAALSALSWIYQYVTGKHPPGADQLDHARMRIANAARDVKDRARDVTGTGHYGGQTTYHTS